MGKLIITNKSDLPMHRCLEICAQVVSYGRISADGKQYCYASRFYVDGINYMVYSNLNKGSDRFTIYKEADNG